MDYRKHPRLSLLAGSVTAYLLGRMIWTEVRKRRLQQTIILVTGGNRGLGREIARQYLRLGATVIILGRDEEALEAARAELSKFGEVIALTGDITDIGRVGEIKAEIENRFGRLDGLVNNAGLVVGGPLASTKPEDYQRLLDANFVGARNMTDAFLPLLSKSGNPWIINISSAAAKLTVPYLVAYGASKATLARYSEGMALQLAHKDIQVLTVYPSLIHSGVLDHAPVLESKLPLRRLYSVLTTIPFLSMSTTGAASRIIDAQARCELKIVIPFTAEIFVRLVYLMPKLSARLARAVTKRIGEA